MQEKIVILDFGSQTTQLIARRIRDLNTYCEVLPYNKLPKDLSDIRGIILSGSPFSVYDNRGFSIELDAIRGKLPILGICYGAQSLAFQFGGNVENTNSREYGRAHISVKKADDPLMKGVKNQGIVWMSHGDTITYLPKEFSIIASTEDVDAAAFRIEGEETWGVQFHPEVHHSEIGNDILVNFLDIVGIRGNWNPNIFIDEALKELRETLKDDKVVLGLSGGVDSSVVAVLLNKAIGNNLTCIFVDHGLLRKDEFNTVLKDYEYLGLNVLGVDASDKFLSALDGISDPEGKRKTIGKMFIEVFDQEATKIDGVKWLAQGTIYPDVIESLSITGTVIKSHHNVGGLPDRMRLKLVEPLRLLFKDEVRKVGLALGMKPHLVYRHPFPGPGLGIRILGNITNDKIRILQDADDIFIRALRENGLYEEIWQAGAVLLPVKSVGVMGDERTYEYTIALRAVTSMDAMSADWAQLPYKFLAKVSNEIINKVRGVNRVVYDISSKPPSTIEWE